MQRGATRHRPQPGRPRPPLASTSLAGLSGLVLAVPLLAVEPTTLTEVAVIGVSPVHGVGLPKDRLPYPVQDADGGQIRDSLSDSLADFMNQRLGSVSINEAQNNPSQPDVQYRGLPPRPCSACPKGLPSIRTAPASTTPSAMRSIGT